MFQKIQAPHKVVWWSIKKPKPNHKKSLEPQNTSWNTTWGRVKCRIIFVKKCRKGSKPNGKIWNALKRDQPELYGNLKLIWRWKWQWGLKLQSGKRGSLFMGSQCSLHSCLQLYSRVAISHQEHLKRVISTVMEVIPFMLVWWAFSMIQN